MLDIRAKSAYDEADAVSASQIIEAILSKEDMIMRYFQRILSIIMAAALLLSLAGGAAAEEGYVPDFTLSDQYEETWTLSELRGKTVMLNFWTTWCPWCLTEMPDLQALYEETGFNTGDIIILGVASRAADSTDEAGIIACMNENGVSYPVLFDPDGELFATWNISAFPTTIFIAPDGVTAYSSVGASDKAGYLNMLQQVQNAAAE